VTSLWEKSVETCEPPTPVEQLEVRFRSVVPSDDLRLLLGFEVNLSDDDGSMAVPGALPRDWWQRSLQGERAGRNVSITIAGWPAHTVAVHRREQVGVALAIPQHQY